MTTGKTIIRGALVAIAVTALGAGIAWATESASKNVPTNSAWQAVIEFDPGVEGAFAKGGKPDNGPRIPDDDVDFKVTFDGDGNCRVDGEVVFSWSPGTIYRIELDSYDVNDTWYVDISIYEGAQLLHQQQGSALDQPIECLHVTAEVIAVFTVVS